MGNLNNEDKEIQPVDCTDIRTDIIMQEYFEELMGTEEDSE